MKFIILFLMVLGTSIPAFGCKSYPSGKFCVCERGYKEDWYLLYKGPNGDENIVLGIYDFTRKGKSSCQNRADHSFECIFPRGSCENPDPNLDDQEP